MYLFERRNQLGPNGLHLREEAYFDFGGAACCMNVSNCEEHIGLGDLDVYLP